MMTPDRRIVEKLQKYDRDLFVAWNNKAQYFEVWRKCTIGSRLITPVTRSIYFEKAPKDFVELDERILWWLQDRDTWRSSPEEHHKEMDKRWEALNAHRDKKRREYFRDVAKDMYCSIKNFYTKRYASRDGRPTFNTKKPTQKWVKPDSQARTRPRLFNRSPQNIKQYFGS